MSLALVSPALAADAPDPAVTAKNREMIAGTPQAAGVFVVQDDGAIRHVQSGLICPARYPNVTFYDVQVYPSDAGLGTDVGCDYRRADDKGGAWSKLTIFVTKAAPDTTADSAFERYQKELMQATPDAAPLGPAFANDPNGKHPDSPLAKARSEEYRVTLNGAVYTSLLIVTVKAGWTIEIRATYIGSPTAINSAREGAQLEIGDRIVGVRAFVDALGTVGQ
ncbi:MAG TPA: hypothetical protein VHZ78_12370 [Rhizomicrobium sp.]|nr:hypothetical protein [Rhizomicrobium sp.]